MTKQELHAAAMAVAAAAINNTPDEVWQQLDSYAAANWSIDPAGMIEIAILNAFGISTD